MEQRVTINEEAEKMPVAEKSEQENGEQGENEEDKDKESLPAIGRLSLNVKAVPYIPKQDGAVGFALKVGDQTRSKTESGPTDKTGEQGERKTSEVQKFSNETQTVDGNEKDLRVQVQSLKQNLKHYEEMIDQYQASEQTRKREVDSALISAREVVERERREKLDVLSAQKTRQEQFEHLKNTLSILQAENEELKKPHPQNEKLAELTRLKTLIQENGFPNIDQFLMLQQQNDVFRDDFFTERKERERLQSQKDKMKRELDAAQSRIASLQEQVYKYREHIFFIQNKSKQSSPFRPLPFPDTVNKRPTNANEACNLYGATAPQYINHQVLMSTINPGVPAAGGDSKYRNDKKNYGNRFGESSGRQWQDGRAQRQPSNGEEWKRTQQNSRNGYSNMNKLTTSTSAPHLAGMVGEQAAQDLPFYDKQFTKPSCQRKARFSLDDASKEFGMSPGDWPKQSVMTNQSKRFSSPLASPSLTPAQSPEFWSPQHAPGIGFQKCWHSNQDEIFRFPPSPLSTPTSKASFDSWPASSALASDDQSVFLPSSSSNDEPANLFPLASPSGGRKGPNFGRFQQSHASNGKVYVCYNCGINFDDNEAHSNHVKGCGH